MAARPPAKKQQQQPPPPPPEPPPPALGPVAKTLIAVGATRAALGPAAAGAVVTAKVVSLPAEVIGEIVEAATKGLIRYASFRRSALPEELESAVRLSHPERTQPEIDRLVELEVAYENAFLSKMKQRLDRDLPKALSLVDPDARRAAVQAILDRERRYIEQRQQATFERALARSEALAAKKVSAKGAYWWLSPLVLKHTPDCIALGEQFWPWSVIEAVGGPPRHPGCRCQLLTEEEATQRGLMTADQANVDEHERLKAAHSALSKAAKVQEAVTDDEWKLWITLLTEGDPLLQLEEAGWATRWPAGTLHGGQFKPKRGGDPGALARRAARRGLRKAAADLLALHFPHYPLPPRVMRHAGAETVIDGRHVFVPHGRGFKRRIGGHLYTSPPGTTTIHRDGQHFLDPMLEGPSALHAKGNMAILTPVEPNVGVRDEVELPLEIPSGVAGRAIDVQRSRGDAFDIQIARALTARSPAEPPVRPGQDSHDAHLALSRNGFVETDIPTYADDIRVPYVAPDGASTLSVVYGDNGQVVSAHWRPTAPAPRGSELTRPPATFDEFADDLRAFGDRIAAQELGDGHRAWLNIIEPGQGKPDHAAEQLWNGNVELGDDFAPDLAAAAAARASGENLTPSLLRGLWAATQSSHHEALHGVNPIGPQDYDDLTERALEESLVEELSHVEAAHSLRLQGQHDAAQWAVDHPGDAKVAGTYLAERVGLAAIADQLGVPATQRENFLRDLKFRVQPGTRTEWLAAQLAGGQPTQAQIARVRDTIHNPPTEAHVAPILAIPGTPAPTPGYPSPAGAVYEGDTVTTSGGDTGVVARIQDPEPDEPWAAAVALHTGGYVYTTPNEITSITPGTRGAATLAGDPVREGDTVSWPGGEAVVDRVLVSSPTGWTALDATVTGGDTPGQRIILTTDNTPGLRVTEPSVHAALLRAGGNPAAVQQALQHPPAGLQPSNRVPDPRAPSGQHRAAERDFRVLPEADLAAVTAWADTTGATLHAPVPGQPDALDRYADAGFHVERGEMVRTGSADPRLRSVTSTAVPAVPPVGLADAKPLSSMGSTRVTKSAAFMGGAGAPVGGFQGARGAQGPGTGYGGLMGRRNAMAVADYLASRIATHRSYGTPQYDHGYYDGLARARRAVARGGGQTELLQLARAHGPLKGGNDENVGFQDALRHAYFEVEGDRREDNLALFHRSRAERPPTVAASMANPPITHGLDYYKATMSHVQYREHPDAQVTFTLKNRGKQRIADFVSPAELQQRLDAFQSGWSSDEVGQLAKLEKVSGGPVFGHDFLAYLSGRPLPPVHVTLDPATDDLHVETTGDWPMVTFWETVVMSELNDAYFQNYIARNHLDPAQIRAEGDRRLSEKIAVLKAHPDIKVAEFGTRRRFGQEWQKHVVERLKAEVPGNLIGSSNIAIANELGIAPIGSYAHEMDMVYAGLASRAGTDVPASHTQMLADWQAAYGDDLSIALTDTFTTKFFFDHLTTREAEHWQGLRHDSGDPFEFGEAAIAWYEDHGIDPKTKTLLFSDALDMDKAVALNDRFKGRVKVAFGIGTNLSNDLGLKPLNIVMKATSVDGEPTVKLSDNPGKHTGSSAKVAEYQKLFGAVPKTPVGELVGGKANQPVTKSVLAGRARSPSSPMGKPNEPAGAAWDDAHTVVISKAAGGTTGAMFATAKNGDKWLVKRYGGNVDRVAAEWLANRVYAALGMRVPEGQTLDFGGKPAFAYPLVAGVPGHPGLKPKDHKLLGRGFMADALLANWDVVGLDYDNLLWPEGISAGNLANEMPYRVDQGGVFEYRAKGELKPYGPIPTEVWSMNEPNGQAFGRYHIDEATKRDGAAVIANRLTDARIDELVDAAPFADNAMRERIRDNLKARVAFMRDYATGKGKANQPLEANVDPQRLAVGDKVRDSDGSVWTVAKKVSTGAIVQSAHGSTRSVSYGGLSSWRFVQGSKPELLLPGEKRAPVVEPKVNVNTVEPGALVRDKSGQVWKIAGRSKGLWLLEQPKNMNVTKQADDSFMKQYTMVDESVPAAKPVSPWTPGVGFGFAPKPEPKPLEGADARIALRSAQEKVELMPEEAAALNAYGQGWADAVNDSLRKGTPEEASDELKYLVKELDSITQFIRTKNAVTLYAALPGGELKPNLKVREKGYLTLTTRRDEAERAAGEKGNVLRLLVPSGANAAYLPAWEVSDGIVAPPDAEVLLPRGSELVVRQQEGRLIDAALVAPARYSYAPKPVKRIVDAPGTSSWDPGTKPKKGPKIAGPPLKAVDGPVYAGDVELAPPPGPTLEQAREEFDRKKRFAVKPPGNGAGSAPPQGKLHGWLPSWLGGGDEPESDSPSPSATKPKSAYPGHSAGVILTEPDGRIWFFEPKGHFGGYDAALSKGHVDEGESPQQAALRELYEETGLTAEITGEVGTYPGDTTLTTYFTGKRTGGAPWKVGTPDETWAVKLAKPEDAAKVLKPRDILALQDAGILAKPPPPDAKAHGPKGKANPATGEPEWRYLWPVHGVAGTPEGVIEPGLEQRADVVISKGMDATKEAYSAFDGETPDGGKLADWLRARGVRKVAVGGLATDYCVKSTALDSAKAGFETWYLPESSRGITAETSLAAEAEMAKAGVQVGDPPEGDAKATALIVVDVQGAFLKGGALAVPDGEAVIPQLEHEADSGRYGSVVASRDWHPPNHQSFAEQRPFAGLVPETGKIKVRVVNHGRQTGGWFSGDLEVNGRIVGRVERGQTHGFGRNQYKARIGGTVVGSETSLAEMTREIRSEEMRPHVIDALAELDEKRASGTGSAPPAMEKGTGKANQPVGDIVYHVAPVHGLEAIGREGITPGMRGLRQGGRTFAFRDRAEAERFAAANQFPTRILPVDVSGLETGKDMTIISGGGKYAEADTERSSAIYVQGPIGPERIQPPKATGGTVIYGGAFNPPHEGHQAVVRAAQEAFQPDRMVVLVSERPGHKRVEGASPEQRLSAAKEAFPGADVQLDPFERTIDMLRSGVYGNDPLLVIGADEFRDFPSWKEPDEVLARARLAVAARPGVDKAALDAVLAGLKQPERVTFFDPHAPAVSSSELRERALVAQLRAADTPRLGKANLAAGAAPVDVAMAKGVDLKAAFAPADASPAHPTRMEYRMRGAAAILEAHAEEKDAVLKLPDDTEARDKLIAAIAVGDVARAEKEYRETPLADLEVLSKITVEKKPVFGQAHANLQSRAVTMGSTSAIGDFRHELGHALRAAMSGKAAPMGKTPMTDFVAKRHSEALSRLKANIQAKKPKPKTHVEWEEQTGLGGRRGKDSWEEDFAEQYRGYQKAVFQTRHPEDKEHDAQALEKYRGRHPEWARFWDSWYTAQLAGRTA